MQRLWTESTETPGPCWETVGRTAQAQLPHFRHLQCDLCCKTPLCFFPVLAAGQENLSPPCSPDLTLERSFRDLKENKEPSPKVKRRRSVKISSVTLEPTQWQSDALQIITCTNDYRSMNDFLMKKVGGEDNGDEKRRRDAQAAMLRAPCCRCLADQRLGHGGQQEGHHGGRGL